MCNLVFLSTTSDEDLEAIGSSLFTFRKTDDPEEFDADILEVLAYPNKWYLESKYGGCSCHYRHEMDPKQFGFHAPFEWAGGEDEENVESTGAVYDVLKRLLDEGHEVDLVDVWNGTDPAKAEVIEVRLSEVPRNEFMFFEGFRFVLCT